MIEICYCIDKNTEVCGFVSMYSMLLHASEKVSIMICYDREEKMPGSNWAKRLNSFGFNFELRYQAIDNSVFRKCRSAYGSFAPYLLLSAPLHSINGKILYVDADTIFSDDIVELFNADLDGKEIAMFQSGTCQKRSFHEKNILFKNKKKEDDLYYSSTICIIDINLFKDSERLQKLKFIATADPFLMMLWDQTVLNCSYINSEVCNLGLKYGRWIQESPRRGKCPQFFPGMIHFCGTPKPWDILGELFHPYYREWKQIANQCGERFTNQKNYFSFAAIKRSWVSRRQYTIWFGKNKT